MWPVLDVAAMRAADATAVAERGTDALVGAAGYAVAREARDLLPSTYGAHVAVVVGPGLNGADGRIAARHLAARGARVEVIPVAEQPDRLSGYDLVVDAAFGLGCRRPYRAPAVTAGTPVLAVDLPSGVDAATGAVLGSPPWATRTLALGALKPAHLTGDAAERCGDLRLETLDITGTPTTFLLEPSDLAGYVRAHRDDHKWRHALSVIAGSPSMRGAAELVTRGALAGGASMIRAWEWAGPLDGLPAEVVRETGTSVDPRSRAVVVGPGLGTDAPARLPSILSGVTVPVVVDADALSTELLAHRPPDAAWVLTPHDGEYARLTGHAPGPDRLAATRELAEQTGCVVLLKGPTTVVAAPDGATRVVHAGTPSLATAGSGDVLAGLVGAALARGHEPLAAASLSALAHGLAGARLATYARSSDLASAITAVLRALG